MPPKLSEKPSELHAAGTGGFGERMRVLAANEPRLYREVIAATLRDLAPDAEVLVVDPEALDRRIEEETPDLVFCNRATPCVADRVPVWVEVFPDDEPLLVVSVGGGRLTTIDDNGLSSLLWIFDQAKLLFEQRQA